MNNNDTRDSACQNNIEDVLYYWKTDFDTEVRRLFGNQLPKTYHIDYISIEPSLTPEEAAVKYFSYYNFI